MKKKYTNPTLDIISISEEDIITASVGGEFTTEDGGVDLPGMDF